MKPSSSLPPLDVDAARAAYGDRFGPLYDSRAGAEESDAPFWILVFWEPLRPGAPVVYASWGAPSGEARPEPKRIAC